MVLVATQEVTFIVVCVPAPGYIQYRSRKRIAARQTPELPRFGARHLAPDDNEMATANASGICPPEEMSFAVATELESRGAVS